VSRYQRRPWRLSPHMITTDEPRPVDRDEGGAPVVDVSVGADVVEVRRVARLAAQPNGLAGVLTERELDYCRGRRRPAEHFAARFAAKEAVLKALGTGLAEGIRWIDVEILKGHGGRPMVALHESAAALAKRRRLRRIDVSLSHTTDFAIASAVALWAHPSL
jgi:holo-[acyl-carrier protein] synthase